MNSAPVHHNSTATREEQYVVAQKDLDDLQGQKQFFDLLAIVCENPGILDSVPLDEKLRSVVAAAAQPSSEQ
jgi:hypothetical protein